MHDPSKDCEGKYEYFYLNQHENKTVRAQYGVTLLIRADTAHPNALLFRFEDHENATKHLGRHPVRVHFDENGKITKTDVHQSDLDSTVSTKKSVILTTQLDWKQVSSALATDGPLTFKSVVKGAKDECDIEYGVVHADATSFEVIGNRNVTECSGTSHKTYEKYKDSTKVWKFAFDKTKSSNFQSLSVDIVDYFAPHVVITIESGFTFQGCEKFSDVWDTSDLIEDNRDYDKLSKHRKQH